MNYLDVIAEGYSTLKGMNHYTNIYQYKIFQDYFIGKNVLELGCADGQTTMLLLRDFSSVTAVDGSVKAISRLKKKIKNKKLTLIQSYFENLELQQTFDVIIMGHILEHVEDPLFILNKFKKTLNPNGRLIISVPNALSFHRLAAVKMGLLNSPYDLSPTDLKIGHRRVFDTKILQKLIRQSGYKILQKEGYWLKFLSNAQIESQWNEDQIRVYMDLGRDFYNNAAEIIVICTLP